MSMVTRCPHCTTSFRITSPVLKMHHGLVRCGHCSEVFNAFDSLSSIHDAPDEIAEPGVAPEALLPEVRVHAPELSGEAAVSSVVPTALEEPSQEAEEELEVLPEEPMEEFFVGEKPSKFGWAWGLGSTLLFVSLLAQAVYYYRMEIGIELPGLKPYLQASCALLGCSIPLPGRIDLIGIESSSLQNQPGRIGVIDLQASIRNGASFAQEYPLLELTLTDAQDAPLARKIFRPSDYLAKDAKIGEGIPANAAVNARLHLDTGTLQASGYRLYLFYP
ncbi:MAG: DUF3426 domain-containing protein [Burkholderiales bacterium]